MENKCPEESVHVQDDVNPTTFSRDAVNISWPEKHSGKVYMFWAEIWKISEFISENFHSLVVKNSVYILIGLFS